MANQAFYGFHIFNSKINQHIVIFIFNNNNNKIELYYMLIFIYLLFYFIRFIVCYIGIYMV